MIPGDKRNGQASPLPGSDTAWTTPVDERIVREFQLLEGRRSIRDFSVVRPRWNSDIRWMGPRSHRAYALFESAFRRLGVPGIIAPMLDIECEPRLYSGFLVARRHCSQPDFHHDWTDTGGQAFTLMTPVSYNAGGFGLLYRDRHGQVREYDYKAGEAIFFGDGFIHSTKPGTSTEDVVLLCFTFGTDRMEYWDRIKATSGSQSALVRRPNGEFERISAWRGLRRHLGWLAHRAGLRRSA